MSDPFELEPEDEHRRPKAPRPEDPPPEAPPEAPPEVGEGIDARTVAERRGEPPPRGATDVLGPPEGWPGEILGFPFRRPGPGFFLVGLLALVALDLIGLIEVLRFPGWTIKLLLLMFVLRAQFRVIGTSAAGRDRPEGWREALAFGRDELGPYLRTLGFFAGALAPGTVLWAFEKVAPGLLLLALGSMYATVVALGAALRDPALKWPWRALVWIARRPLHCLAGSLGWWVLLGSEIALSRLVHEGIGLYVFVAIILRVACLYALLAAARVIGVMGRAWTL